MSEDMKFPKSKLDRYVYHIIKLLNLKMYVCLCIDCIDKLIWIEHQYWGCCFQCQCTMYSFNEMIAATSPIEETYIFISCRKNWSNQTIFDK